jgi:hypothetical protein
MAPPTVQADPGLLHSKGGCLKGGQSRGDHGREAHLRAEQRYCFKRPIQQRLPSSTPLRKFADPATSVTADPPAWHIDRTPLIPPSVQNGDRGAERLQAANGNLGASGEAGIRTHDWVSMRSRSAVVLRQCGCANGVSAFVPHARSSEVHRLLPRTEIVRH